MHHLVKIADSLPINYLLGYLSLLLKNNISLTSLDEYGYSPIHLLCIYATTQIKARDILMPILWDKINKSKDSYKIWQHKTSFGASLVHL